MKRLCQLATAAKMLSGIVRVGGMLSAIAVCSVMLMIVTDIFLRTFFGKTVRGQFEISQIILVFIIFSSFGITQAMKKHLRVELFLHRMPQKQVLVSELIAFILSLAYVASMAVVTGMLAYSSTRQGEYAWGLINVPVWPARVVISLGTAILAIQILSDSIQLLRRWRNGSGVEESS